MVDLVDVSTRCGCGGGRGGAKWPATSASWRWRERGSGENPEESGAIEESRGVSGAQGRGPRRRGRGGLILPLVVDGEAVRVAGWSGGAKAQGGRGCLSPFRLLFKTFLFSFNSSLLHFLLQ